MMHLPDLLRNPAASRQTTKMAWRLCRQFQCAEQFALEFGEPLECVWNVEKRSGGVESQAIKLLLNQPANQASRRQCESVALLPLRVRPQTTTTVRRMPRATACISSQPGCGVGCPFCATSELGYRGNLSAMEIAEQVYWTGLVARQHGFRLRNVVFMGMGEPLHNVNEVLTALSMITHERLFGLRARHITVSTIGVPSAMLELAKQHHDLRLAVSLHSVQPALRRRLVPHGIADMSVLHRAITGVNSLQPGQAVWLEMVLFDQLNDSPKAAEELLEFCHGLKVEVNLIPYNVAAGSQEFRPVTRLRRESFAAILRNAGIRCSIRTSFGTAQNAACGQLTTA